jgi:hypothetical protein
VRKPVRSRAVSSIGVRVLPALGALLPSLLLSVAARSAPPADEPPRFVLGASLSALEPLEERDLREAELLYAFLSGAFRQKGWGARLEVRGREGLFRPYFPGSVWVEEAYAFVDTPVGEVRAGKVQAVVGLEDETFGGDLFSLNGVNRNPDWGVQVSGSRAFGWHALDWAARWVGQNDHVAWEEAGKGVESDPSAVLRDGLSGRLSFLFNKGLWSLRPGLSAATARVVPDDARPDYRRTDGIVDLTATVGPLAVLLEGLARSAPDPAPGEARPLAERDGRAFRAEVRMEFPESVFRYTYSEWRYTGAGSNERIHQPAAVWKGRKGIEAVVEYASRRIRTGDSSRTFNAFRLGLVLRLPFGLPAGGRAGKG